MTSDYTPLDRVLHRMAFDGVEIQKSLADIEDHVFAGRIREIAVDSPIFVTSLPRAGTTLLLNALMEVPGMATHTYRQMPFILCPLLWDAISRPLRRPNATRERRHGDGMAVGYDSPEAFEEAVWLAFWPDKYDQARIRLWIDRDRSDEFEAFLKNHVRKIIALNANSGACRYVSKNNANIGRIALIGRLFPHGTILVPFRDPIDHASSLLHQHLRFLDVHANDRFSKLYMAGIGHFEFGELHKRIAFRDYREHDDRSLEYWLEYWIAAFEHLMQLPDIRVNFIDYSTWCAKPNTLVEPLSQILCLSSESMHHSFRDVRFSRRHGNVPTLSGVMLDEARFIHQQLCVRAINC